MFKNKRAIELSINFIVMLVLGIAMFAGGLAFASKFFMKAEQVRTNLDSQTQKQIEKLLDSGTPVVIPISTKEINKNKFDTYGIGVLAKYYGNYIIDVHYKSAFRKDKTAIVADAEAWLQVPTKSIELQKNAKGKFLVGVQVPRGTIPGTYIFEVTVGFESLDSSVPSMPEYDNPLQFFVKVP